MSFKPMQGTKPDDAQHADLCGIFGNLVQETKADQFGGYSQAWFTLNGTTYHAVIEVCKGPLLDLSDQNTTPSVPPITE